MSVDPSQFPTASPEAAPAPSEPTVAELEAKVAALETEVAAAKSDVVAPVTPPPAPPKPSLADRLKELVFGENKTLDDALSTLGSEGYANDPLVAVVEVLVKAVLG